MPEDLPIVAESGDNRIDPGELKEEVCPECDGEVYPLKNFSTMIDYKPHHDKDGNIHEHDPNYTIVKYACSNGHEWVVTEFKACWCGWKGGVYGIRTIQEVR